MRLYLDTSTFVSLFLQENRTAAVEQLVNDAPQPVHVSDFTEGEFIAAISTNVRTGRITAAMGTVILEDASAWMRFQTDRAETTTADIRVAMAFVRRFDLGLLFPDALHLAISSRVEATLLTGDQRQGDAGKALGLPVILV